jgi:hypothetical protein
VTVGFAIFIVSIGLIPVLPLLGVSAAATAAFSGVMVVAAELMLIVGAAVAGKEGFALIKAKVFGYLKAYGPPREVSRRRYRIGLVMFVVPLAFGWVSPYLGHHIPGFESNQWLYAVLFDLLLLISLFVLGGGFWDKLHSLFRHNAYVVFPHKQPSDDKPE